MLDFLSSGTEMEWLRLVLLAKGIPMVFWGLPGTIVKIFMMAKVQPLQATEKPRQESENIKALALLKEKYTEE